MQCIAHNVSLEYALVYLCFIRLFKVKKRRRKLKGLANENEQLYQLDEVVMITSQPLLTNSM